MLWQTVKFLMIRYALKKSSTRPDDLCRIKILECIVQLVQFRSSYYLIEREFFGGCTSC